MIITKIDTVPVSITDNSNAHYNFHVKTTKPSIITEDCTEKFVSLLHAPKDRIVIGSGKCLIEEAILKYTSVRKILGKIIIVFCYLGT